MGKTLRYITPAVLVCLLIVGSKAQAQTRGTYKIQPRYFNPFAVSTDFASSPFAAEEAVVTAGAVESSVVSVPVVAASSGRPTYRPPVRSPYRPPPRPAF